MVGKGRKGRTIEEKITDQIGENNGSKGRKGRTIEEKITVLL